jgi:2-hydroxychromene-2-carboxylate isomerase
MTINVDLYYTMRSPYCYLSTPQLVKLTEEFDLHFHLKPVYPPRRQ